MKNPFNTQTLALIPLAIVINIVMGELIAVLKLPFYLDSIGTVLVGILAGPLAGGLTGLLSNLIWSISYSPSGAASFVASFAPIAALVGVIAGLFGGIGWFRRKPSYAESFIILTLGTILLMVLIELTITAVATTYFAMQVEFPAWIFIPNIIIGVIVAFFASRTRLRELSPAIAAGIVTGIVAALTSAPIATYVFGGVTGAGTDLLVAAFQGFTQNLQSAVLLQGTTSDLPDKMVSFVIVYLVLRNLPRRLLVRFPQGDKSAEPRREPLVGRVKQ